MQLFNFLLFNYFNSYFSTIFSRLSVLFNSHYFLSFMDILPIIMIVFSSVSLLAFVILIFFFPPKKMQTRELTYAAAAIAASLVLSMAKVSPVANGGSITAASCIPLMIYCYVFGIRRGMLAAFVFSLLHMLFDPYFVHFFQVMLDYILPFSVMGLVSLLKPISKHLKGFDIVIMLFLVYFFRYTCHVFAGVWFWETPFVASLIYNATYIPVDFAVACLVTIIFVVTKTLARFERIMKPEQKKEQYAPPGYDQ